MQVFDEWPRNLRRSLMVLSLNDLAKSTLVETLVAFLPKTCMNQKSVGVDRGTA